MITIFTPTFNRAKTLPRLYKSLCDQDYHNFEWVIVDDGSTDATQELVKGWETDGLINLRYFKKENEGKHIAINYGLRMANGEIFFIVDSDDYLVPNALSVVNKEFTPIMNDDKFAGIVCQLIDINGSIVGGEGDIETIDIDSISFRFKHNGGGDHAEIFKTKVLQKFPFPEFKGERFCTENLIWNRIATDYIMRYVGQRIYVCEYRTDGLSNQCLINKIKSPQYSMLQTIESAKNDKIPLKQKIKDYSNYWRYFFFSNTKISKAIKDGGFNSLLFLPLGFVLYLKSKKLLTK